MQPTKAEVPHKNEGASRSSGADGKMNITRAFHSNTQMQGRKSLISIDHQLREKFKLGTCAAIPCLY
jgi:hypothetical protein